MEIDERPTENFYLHFCERQWDSGTDTPFFQLYSELPLMAMLSTELKLKIVENNGQALTNRLIANN